MDAGPMSVAVMWSAVGFALVAVVTGRRWALTTASLAAASATLVLGIALLVGDFSLAYVAETTSLATPWPYRLAAVWGGMDGSMLFFSSLTLAVGACAVGSGAPVRVVGGVGAGLLLVTVFFANPFVVLDLPAVDGQGLLAILQHPAMIYHPPLLYLGLTVLVVPFALVVAARATDGERWWMARIRRWMYVSWTLLTLGMVFGANWAYVELGWGGYWAWDPVENTALMPWLAVTVFLHTSRVEEATGRLRRWNVLFASLPFALTVLGVYLTRSGATGSIHSFAEDPVVGRILILAAAAVAAMAVVVSIRSAPGETWGRLRLDRDTWLAGNAMTLTAALVFIAAGSVYPAVSSVFWDDAVAVDSRFFVVTVLPLAVVVAAGIELSLRRGWSWYVAVVGVIGVGLIPIVGSRPGVLVMAPALASLVFLGHQLWRNRVRGRLLTAHLAHVGMALLLVGIAGSSFGDEFNGSMRIGDTARVSGHEVTLETIDSGEADRFVFVAAGFDVDGEPLTAEIRAYEDQSVPVAEPALRSTPAGDVIVAMSLLFPDAETIEVSVLVRPLVWWVWAGAGTIALAGLVALVARAGAAATPRRSATAAPLPGGTTSGSAAR